MFPYFVATVHFVLKVDSVVRKKSNHIAILFSDTIHRGCYYLGYNALMVIRCIYLFFP